ncbi:transglutaminase family protein [Mesorhizobium sp. B2-4-12]|uniref:transglutaminase family protein n=1 Tax=unclassified Mesorhizobium TaxID=325217 RepID=UPI00112A3423|nr:MULTISPECIES: transglutaminase family protein [unclassified Mesorhizobium]TPK98760.1 transglutaminase family protein [Mesorhizobium sp. B2-4-12]TPL12426.1 transglutaminase family protein [Mesorhizobium sp. B2-4-14]
MLYDIRLHLHYDYAAAAGGGRHQIRVLPSTISGVQRVIAASLSCVPAPNERSDFSDFFGNNVTSIAFRDAHDALDIRMSARVSVSRPEPGLDVSPDIGRLRQELAAVRSLAPDAPHHFLSASSHAGIDAAITSYAHDSVGNSAAGTAMNLCNRIHRDFTYDGEATTVRTRASDAFRLKRGVCQDFSHIMIAGLRGLGIPAGYVSGFLRTIPPKGKPRLEGADAMHAWVKVWCGRDAGWQEFDPTNGMRASNDHITVGYGRDYSDVAPIVGVLKTTGGQVGEQAVDVIPVALEKA